MKPQSGVYDMCLTSYKRAQVQTQRRQEPIHLCLWSYTTAMPALSTALVDTHRQNNPPCCTGDRKVEALGLDLERAQMRREVLSCFQGGFLNHGHSMVTPSSLLYLRATYPSQSFFLLLPRHLNLGCPRHPKYFP